eukprot:384713-Rhodomonas_salina.1
MQSSKSLRPGPRPRVPVSCASEFNPRVRARSASRVTCRSGGLGQNVGRVSVQTTENDPLGEALRVISFKSLKGGYPGPGPGTRVPEHFHTWGGNWAGTGYPVLIVIIPGSIGCHATL